MNMLARFSGSALLEREPQDLLDLRRAPAGPVAETAPAFATRPFAFKSPEEEAAYTLLARDERVLVLLSRDGSRLSAHAGSWAASAESFLPALSAESQEARERQARLAALRRFAILFRLDRSGLAFEEEKRMAAAGYSDAQLAAIRFLVERFDRGELRPGSRWTRSLAFLGLAGAGAWALQSRIGPAIDDALLAWLLSLLAATAIASFLSVTAHPREGRR